MTKYKSKHQLLDYQNIKMHVKAMFFIYKFNKGKCRKRSFQIHLSRGEYLGLPQVI